MKFLKRYLGFRSQSAAFLRALAVAIVLLDLLVCALVVFSLQRAQSEVRREVGADADNLALLLQSVEGILLQRTDGALRMVSAEVGRELADGAFDARAFNDWVARAFSGRVNFNSLHVADDRGNIVYSAGAPPELGRNIAGRDFFARLSSDPLADLSFSTPTAAAPAGTRSIIIARRCRQRNGDFAGVAYGEVSLERLQQAFAALALGAHGLASLHGPDFEEVLRQPPADDDRAAAAPLANALREHVFANPDAGAFTSRGGDGVERTNAYRKLMGEYPYYLVVGLAAGDYLAAWRMQAFETFALAICFVFATAILYMLVRIAWTRRDAAIAMLRNREHNMRKALDWTPDALVIIDRQGLISMVNQQAEKLFGYARDEMVGQKLDILMPKRFRDGHGVMVRRYADGARTRQMASGRELRGLTKDGREIAISISLSPIETKGGTLYSADIRDLSAASSSR